MRIKQSFSWFYPLLLLFSFSCKHNLKPASKIDPTWIKFKLPHGWQISAPPGFVCKPVQGVDSEPGYIFNKQKSIILEFDSGVSHYVPQGCSLENIVRTAKGDIDTGFYKKDYEIPEVHMAYIDTIDNKIAMIVKPVDTTNGTLGISFPNDCKNGAWFGLRCRNVSAETEKLVLAMFSTIKRIE